MFASPAGCRWLTGASATRGARGMVSVRDEPIRSTLVQLRRTNAHPSSNHFNQQSLAHKQKHEKQTRRWANNHTSLYFVLEDVAQPTNGDILMPTLNCGQEVCHNHAAHDFGGLFTICRCPVMSSLDAHDSLLRIP